MFKGTKDLMNINTHYLTLNSISLVLKIKQIIARILSGHGKLSYVYTFNKLDFSYNNILLNDGKLDIKKIT